jgi:hypothetical protein
MTKSRYLLLALTNHADGREADYNTWFDEHHIPEVLSIDGFISAQRYQLAGEQRMPGPLPYTYAAAYRIQTDDLKGVLAALGEVVATGTRTDAGDPARRAIWVLEPLGPERTA